MGYRSALAMLSRDQLNRTLLARQLLLERQSMPVEAVIAHLVGMQAQVASEPYIGLWARLTAFTRPDLDRLLTARHVVRATLMRSTLHLMTARDYLRFRETLQPALTRALYAFFGQKARALTLDPIIAAGRDYLTEQPRTFATLRAMLSAFDPTQDAEAMAYVIRSQVPIVQVPRSDGLGWGYSNNPDYVLAEQWLGEPINATDEFRAMVWRYLTAFGPASIKDVQAWSGFTNLAEPFKALRSELRSYRDEQGVELFDLPDLSLAEAEIEAPIRFLPEYDNLILSHADRSRVVPDEYRGQIYLSAGRVRATFLVNGYVAGVWKSSRLKQRAELLIEPCRPLAEPVKAMLTLEADRLLRFIEADAETFVVAFAE